MGYGGGGEAWQHTFADLDGDGWEDIILGDHIYQNLEGKGFQDVTSICNLRLPRDGVGIAIADYDRDGRLDLYITRPGEKKISSIHVQTMVKTSTRAGITQKQSAKFAPFSLSPIPPGPPETRREAHSRLKMPGAFPGTSLDDVDMSSWVLVDSVSPDCRVENSNRSWFKRMFSRFG